MLDSSGRTGEQSYYERSRAVKEALYAAAQRRVVAGISLIPIGVSGTKAPCWQLLPELPDASGVLKPTWRPYQKRLPTQEELITWFQPGTAEWICGIGVVCGAVSGGLEVIDFDDLDTGYAWIKRIEAISQSLIAKLVYVRTPRPGLHVFYRCQAAEPSQKLARGILFNRETKKDEIKTLVETRGEHSYVVAPPSPGRCHPSGKCYELMTDDDIANVAMITPEERAILISAARECNEYVAPIPPRPSVRPLNSAPHAGGPCRPGEDYNARASWPEILEPHGWRLVKVGDDGTQYWCRPGKDGTSVSATADFEGWDVFYVFSTNASPFEDEKGYTKFSAYALLNHAGDFRAAAGALRRKGYGTPVRHTFVDPFACYSQFVPRRGGSTE